MCQAGRVCALDSLASWMKVVTGKGWGRSCNTEGAAADLKFAWWGEVDASAHPDEAGVCYARWCARQTEQKIIVSTRRKDHELQWFPKAPAEDLPRLRLHPLYLCMSPQTAVSTDDFASRGIDGVPPSPTKPRVLIQHLIMRKKMLFQLKPQAMFEGGRKRRAVGGEAADSRAWHAMQQEEEGKKKEKNRWRWKISFRACLICVKA